MFNHESTCLQFWVQLENHKLTITQNQFVYYVDWSKKVDQPFLDKKICEQNFDNNKSKHQRSWL